MIDQHTLETLEFPKILALISGKCLTPFGPAEVSTFTPLFNKSEIERRQTEIAQMKDILQFGLPFPLNRMGNCRDFLAKARIPGIFLDPAEILSVLELVDNSIALNGYDKDGRAKFPAVAEYLGTIRAFPELKKEIKHAIDERGEIKDDASPALRKVRMELGENRRKIIRQLEQLLSGKKKQPGWTDDVVTQRSGRYVIPVPANGYRADMGILHDRSQSGATLYIEPAETVELNNRINMLFQEERLEMDRILRALTSEIADRADALLQNTNLIGRLDAMHAAASFAVKIKAEAPAITSDAVFSLVEARHPLLIVKFGGNDKVVPMAVGLDDTRRAILVTGPNTGGKTIALKTIGLLVLMAQSGLLIPADHTSRVGIFQRIFADIGDEQSIELSLSTFSSHITNIISALNNLFAGTLVLFDEIGAGTDPKEGAALAEAIITHIVNSGARMVVTTHYSQLKTLALDHPGIDNASLEFDRDTLTPTYRLLLGIPGSSFAVEIAERLGLHHELCREATRIIGGGERSLTDLIASLEGELNKIHQDRNSLAERLANATELETEYQARLGRFKTEMEEQRQKDLAETEALLTNTRKETERLVAEIRQSQASKESVKAIHGKLKDTKKQLDSIRARTVDKDRSRAAIRFMKGDLVRIATLNQSGQIVQLIGNDRAKVRVGNLNTVVELRNLRPAEAAPASKPASRTSKVPTGEGFSPEIHLRGMTAEEAQEALDRFIDSAIVTGMTQIYVIHGKGTGVLRRTLTEYLRKHPEVVDLRLGNWNEGGAGVTVVKLKE
jgi:DNA mismatch repair protein MutS2